MSISIVRQNEIAEKFCTESVPHEAERRALADRLSNCRDGQGYGGFSWIDKWMAVKEIEDLVLALIKQHIPTPPQDGGNNA